MAFLVPRQQFQSTKASVLVRPSFGSGMSAWNWVCRQRHRERGVPLTDNQRRDKEQQQKRHKCNNCGLQRNLFLYCPSFTRCCCCIHAPLTNTKNTLSYFHWTHSEGLWFSRISRHEFSPGFWLILTASWDSSRSDSVVPIHPQKKTPCL